MLEFFDIGNTAATIAGYKMSWLELVSTVLALGAVIAARKNSLWFYPLGILNSVGFIALFHQIDLYSSALLNVYFIIISFYGWYIWTRKDGLGYEYPVRYMDGELRMSMLLAIGFFTLLLWYFVDDVYGALAGAFDVEYKRSAFAFLDSLTAVMSVFAMYTLAKRYVEAWVLWVLVDIICVYVYWAQGAKVLSVEYGIFLLNAIYGVYQWHKLSLQQHSS